MPYTTLHEAAKCGDIVAASTLLGRSSCNIDVTDSCDKTPMYYAISNGREEMVKWLLENGSTISNLYSTPLHCAAFYGHQNLCKLFLDNGYNVDATDFEKKTALHRAFVLGYHAEMKRQTCDLAKILVDHGADINARSRHGDTALHIATYHDHRGGAQFLVECGADIHVINSYNESPFQIAMRQNPALAVRLDNAAKQWQRASLMTLALLLKPLDLPVLVLWTIYNAKKSNANKYGPKRFTAWALLKKLKQIGVSDV